MLLARAVAPALRTGLLAPPLPARPHAAGRAAAHAPADATEQCFSQVPIVSSTNSAGQATAVSGGWLYVGGQVNSIGVPTDFSATVQLPAGMTCDGSSAKCVLRWYYLTGARGGSREGERACQGQQSNGLSVAALLAPMPLPPVPPLCPLPRRQLLHPRGCACRLHQPQPAHLRRCRRALPRGGAVGLPARGGRGASWRLPLHLLGRPAANLPPLPPCRPPPQFFNCADIRINGGVIPPPSPQPSPLPSPLPSPSPPLGGVSPDPATFCANKPFDSWWQDVNSGCTAYYRCVNPAIRQACPTGLRFDAVAKVCNWASAVPCPQLPAGRRMARRMAA